MICAPTLKLRSVMLKKKRYSFYVYCIYLLLVVIFGGCATIEPWLMPLGENKRDELAQTYFTKGEEAVVRGDLSGAQRYWRVVLELKPEHVMARAALPWLKTSIEKKIEEYLAQAQSLTQDSSSIEQRKQAWILYLKVLALDANNTQAFEALRALEGYFALSKIRTKIKKEQLDVAEHSSGLLMRMKPKSQAIAHELEPEQDTDHHIKIVESPEAQIDEKNVDVIDHEYNKHFFAEQVKLFKFELVRDPDKAEYYLQEAMKRNINDDAKKRDIIAKNKLLLAEVFYKQGLVRYSADLDQAVVYWRKALEYNPGHRHASMQYRKASRILQALTQMK